MKSNSKITAWAKGAAVAALSAGLVAGCGSGKEESTSSASPGASNAPASAAPAQPVNLSYWVELQANAARSLKDYNESLFYQELEKRTGVKVKFQHPAVGTAKEQFNLLIASGNLPDVIEYDFTAYSGGPEKAISDKIIIELNDVIDKHAPNLKKYLEANPVIKREVTTDNGKMYVFPAIGAGNTDVTSGLMLRKDWLDELGLAVPETIDEWTNVLRQFKEKKGAKAPLSFALTDFDVDRFNGAYGVGVNFYQENGKVKFGPYEPAFKDYLALLHSWYKEGLLDPDFATQDAKAKTAKATNGAAGAFSGYIGSAMGTYLDAMKTSNPAYDLAATQHPVLKKGDEPRFIPSASAYRGTGSAAITPANKHVVETAKWLDYLYSEEGNLLKSFGVDGQTYKLENNYPKYTDLIVNNPDKLSIGDAMAKYLRVAAPSPGFVGDDRYTEQYYTYQQQKDAVVIYNKYSKNLENIRLGRITETPEEGQEVSSIMAEVNTYRKEMFLKFVMGGESLDNFDKYLNQLKSMKIERVIEIKQAALERYNKR
ncbi:MAG: extracellular solute-binding protein family 1 [Paenibacillaceae bacterium]|nr:extracellular solute-binding protein family 1 [Paenibacillaceae bacterium]